MPCHLIVCIVVHTFDDINFAGLHIIVRFYSRTMDGNTDVGPLTATQGPPSRPHTYSIVSGSCESCWCTNSPQPHGAWFRSRMNKPARMFSTLHGSLIRMLAYRYCIASG